MTSAVRVSAPAKINLALRVGNRRPDGYHDLETLFQTVGFGDRITVRARHGSGLDLHVVGADLGPAEDNLVTKAARLFFDATGVRARLYVCLEKRIPAGSGLGGGSSDAAATLKALARLFPGRLSRGEIAGLGAELGSDVPFFLCGSPLALGRGRGEILRPLTPLPVATVWLALPEALVATPWAYAALDSAREHRVGPRDPGVPGAHHGTGAGFEADVRLTDWHGVADYSSNDFEEVVLPQVPRVRRALEALRGRGALLVRMSGSGAAVYALHEGRLPLDMLASWGREADARMVVTRTLRSVPRVRAVRLSG